MFSKVEHSIESTAVAREFTALAEHFKLYKPVPDFDKIEIEDPSKIEPTKDILIGVIQGRGLANKDLSPGSGKSDPYLKITCGTGEDGTSWQTEVKKDTLDPVWNAPFVIPAVSWAKHYIVIECWDHNKIEKDSFMGEIILEGREMKTGTSSLWYPLKPNKKKGGDVSGEIELKITKRPE